MLFTRDKQFFYIGESIPNDLGTRRVVRQSREAFHADTVGSWSIYDDSGALAASDALAKSADGTQFDIFVPLSKTEALAAGEYTFLAKLENTTTGFSKVVEAFEFRLMSPAV